MFLPQKPSQPDTSADTSASETKDEAKKPPPADTTDSEGKEETAKESNVTVSQQPLNCISCLRVVSTHFVGNN